MASTASLTWIQSKDSAQCQLHKGKSLEEAYDGILNGMRKIKITIKTKNDFCKGCNRCAEGVWAAGVIVVIGKQVLLVQHSEKKHDFNDFGGCCYDWDKEKLDKTPAETAARELYEESLKTINVTAQELEECPYVEFDVPCAVGLHKCRAYIYRLDKYDKQKYYDALNDPNFEKLDKCFKETCNLAYFDISHLRRAYTGNQQGRIVRRAYTGNQQGRIVRRRKRYNGDDVVKIKGHDTEPAHIISGRIDQHFSRAVKNGLL